MPIKIRNKETGRLYDFTTENREITYVAECGRDRSVYDKKYQEVRYGTIHRVSSDDIIKAAGLWDEHTKILEDFEKRRLAAEKKANSIFDEFQKELKAISEKYDCYIDYQYFGDTHGIYDEHQFISTHVDGFDFKRVIQEG